MDNFLLNCNPVNVGIGNHQHRAYLCKFCGSLTKIPDIPHMCPGVNAPEYLKGAAVQAYFKATKLETYLDNFVITYEKVDPEC